MGDRCYLSIEFWRKDLERFEDVLGTFDELYNGNLTLVEGGICEANYGCWSEIEDLAEEGLVFSGWHDAGANYAGAVFAAYGGELVELMAIDGDPVVSVHPDGVGEKTLAVAHRYFELLGKLETVQELEEARMKEILFRSFDGGHDEKSNPKDLVE